MKAALAVVLIVLALGTHPASAAPIAASPQGTLHGFLTQANAILRDVADPQVAWRDLQRLAAGLFDGQAAARRTLGAEWDRRTVQERAELSDIVGGVLARAYLELARSRLPRGQAPVLRVLGEDVGADGAATVRTTVRARDGSDVQLDYLMDRGAGRWRVYDVIVDGISVVENYRAQFARLARLSSYAEAVAALRRVAGVGTAEAAPPTEVVAYFASGQAELDTEARAGLDRLAARLAADERARILLESYADARGATRGNDALAERRAAAVRRYLIGRGADGARIETIVHGARRPVCRDDSEACWAQNRRVVARLE
jgi:outer membrane protein OmpA-like peptidoglycan-associated protein